MKKKYIKILSLLLSIVLANSVNAAVVIKKEDAGLYSKKSDFATELDTGNTSNGSGLGSSSGGGSNFTIGGGGSADDLSERFVCITAKKEGDTYVNTWSNYKLTINEGKQVKSASDFYDFTSSEIRYDFGLYWPDWSRLAVYYTRLSRSIDEVATTFAPKGGVPRNVMIAGEVYRYVQEAVEYPYGIEYYDYYLRNVDGKLMVIECFHEDEDEIAPTYIEQFERYN